MTISHGVRQGVSADDEEARGLAEVRAAEVRALAESLQEEVLRLVKAQLDRADESRRAWRLPVDEERSRPLS